MYAQYGRHHRAGTQGTDRVVTDGDADVGAEPRRGGDSSEAFRVADAAVAAGHEIRVVPSILAKQLGVGERSQKTDVRDARKLSEILS